jgi:polysaccharide biosynthesis/export protein
MTLCRNCLGWARIHADHTRQEANAALSTLLNVLRTFVRARVLVKAAALVWSIASISAATAEAPATTAAPLVQIGVGDEIKYEVYGQSEMNSTLHVADDGSISIPLAGAIQVQGLSPAQAAERAEHALRAGYLVNPHVSIAVTQSRGQKVSVLGEVGNPGRYAVDSKTTLFDVLAQAGGVTENGADEVFILRPQSNGSVARIAVNVRRMDRFESGTPMPTLQPGDSVSVPRADQFYIYGEVTAPNKYRIETNMTVIQAIARAGGVTARGSSRRVEIKRRTADGNYTTFSAKASDVLQADDVLRVKESIF